MIRTYNNGNPMRDYTYDFNYINPWYQQNKHFKEGNFVNQTAGNYNVLYKSYSGLEWAEQLVVKESIGAFPTILEHHINTIGLISTYYFTYYDIINDIPEIILEAHTLLSIEYYDLIGRKISKPTKGFYIERQTTDKGMVSKKYFIK